MLQKKIKEVVDTSFQIKRPLSHKGFYTLLLTALMGMFLFVTYYAAQQVQVYRSQAATCRPGGATCGTFGVGGCCAGYHCGAGICKPDTTSGGGTGGGSGGSCTNVCTAGTAKCTSGNAQVCQKQSSGCTGWTTTTCQYGCENGACKSAAAPTATGTPAPEGCGGITTSGACNADSGCHWFVTTPGTYAGYCGVSCDSYSDAASCAAGGCGWNSDLQCCGGGPSCTSDSGSGGSGDSSGEGSSGTDDTTKTGSGGETGETGGTGGTGETASVTLNLTLSFQGIKQAPASGENFMDVLVTLAGGPQGQSIASTGTFAANSSGKWTGQVSFDGVATGGGYRVMVKGPKHIQKKICDAAPSETSPGTYHCGDGDITINTGANIFDFSGAKLLVGDLPQQDGIIDSYDIALIRNSFCTTDNPNVCTSSNILSKADLNLDGIIDTQDYSSLISSLSIGYDEK